MRIRKHASKLLGVVAPTTSYSPPQTHHAQIWAASPSCAAVASVGAWQICQLNRSPWDVLPYANSADSLFLHCELQAFESSVEENGSVIKYEVKNEEDGSNAPITEMLIAENSIDDDSRRKSLPKKKKKSSVATSSEETTTRTPTLCKKSDGKKWHCKRVALNYHSFCDYHLNQLRSYNQTTTNKIKSVPKTKTSRKDVLQPADGDNSKYYYYTGFGRCSRRRAAMQDAKDDSTEDKQEVTVEGSGIEVDDCRGEEEDDHSEEDMRKDHHRKGRRRRIKARSLKSLL